MKMDYLLKCIANKNRRNILFFLGKKERCVCEFTDGLDLEQSLISHHLKSLKCCGLVKARQEGKNIYYRLTDSEIYSILKKIKSLSEKLDINGECI